MITYWTKVLTAPDNKLLKVYYQYFYNCYRNGSYKHPWLKYIEDILKYCGLRNAFVKFRTTNHRLPIETGKWRNIDRILRFCTLCNKNCIGDEFRYFLECTYYDKLRKLYLHRKYFVAPNIIKFKELLTSTNFETLGLLTIFIKKILIICSS